MGNFRSNGCTPSLLFPRSCRNGVRQLRGLSSRNNLTYKKTRLLCMSKEPCFVCKRNLFTTQRRLVCNTNKPLFLFVPVSFFPQAKSITARALNRKSPYFRSPEMFQSRFPLHSCLSGRLCLPRSSVPHKHMPRAIQSARHKKAPPHAPFSAN